MHCMVIVVMIFSGMVKAAETQVPTVVPNQVPISINIHSSPVAHSSTSSVQNTQVRQDLFAYIKPFFSPESKRLASKKINEFSLWLSTSLVDNKKKVGAGFLLGVYGALSYLLFRTNNSIEKSLRWGLWKETMSVEQLKYVSQKKLSKELVFSIQERYQVRDNLTDFLTPFVAFFKEIDQEIMAIEKLIKLTRIIKVCRALRFFPVHHDILILQQRLERLAYLKELLLHWITDYKIQLNVPDDLDDCRSSAII